MKMKRKLIYSILTTMIFCSCNDMLDKDPIDFTGPTTWYQNQEELEMSLAATYNYLQMSYEMPLAVWFPMANDLYFDRSSSAITEMVQFNTHSTSNPTVLTAWKYLYQGINNANMFLENADQAKDNMPAETLKNMKGEALFLRAYYHFMLTAYWGDVPYRDKSTASALDGHIPVTPRATVFEYIIKDMKDALDMLPEITVHNIGGRASKSAAKGMLARMYLYAAGMLDQPAFYTDARYWAEQIIDDGRHALNPSFEDVFIKYMKDEYDIKESIFEIEAYGSERSNNSMQIAMWSTYFTPQFSGIGEDMILPIKNDPEGRYIARGRNVIISTPKFFHMFQPGDLRRDWTLSTQLCTPNTNPVEFFDYNVEYVFRYPGKFRRLWEKPPVYTWGNSANMPLLRYSDVLLMFAEADNEVNNGPSADALEAINKVRRRGYGKPVDPPDASVDISITGYDEFKEFIMEERARELAFETHRKLDLIRWGTFVQALKDVGTEIANLPTQIYDPISGSMINNPAIIQNGAGVSWTMSDLTPAFINVDKRHVLMPIPEDEITTNNEIKKNNPGW